MPFTEDFNTTGTKELLPHLSVNNDKDIQESPTSEQPGMSVTEDVGTTETAAADVNTSDNTAVLPKVAVKEDTDTTEIKAVQPGISTATEVMKTTDTTAELKDSEKPTATVHPGMSCTEDMYTTECTAMQSGISATSVDTTKPMRIQHENMETEEETDKSDDITQVQITEDEDSDRTSQRVVISRHRYNRKTKDKYNDTKHTHPKMFKKKDRMSRKRKSSGFEKSGQKESEVVHHKIQRTGRISRNPGTPPPSPQSIATGCDRDSCDFMVHIGLNEESYVQQMRDLDNQRQTRSVREKKKKLKAAWEKCKAQHDETTNEVITNEESQQRVDYNCRKHFGNVKSKGNKKCSLAIHLDIPTMYNLYRLEHTCLSGSFPDSFEPLLITDKMREEADKVGLQLKLKATYDQARFDELELFFINRDGGGLKPVKVYDDVIEGKDAEEIHIDDDDTGQKSETVVTRRVDSGSQTEQRQSTEDIQSKSEMERKTLESQLKEAKKEKSTLEERCKELTQKLESTEQSLVSQRIGNKVEREKLQSELKENQKLVKELQDKVKELEHALELSNLKKSGDKGDWSMTLVDGQYKDQEQQFKSPGGLAFHCNKLVVCDSGNNIVQILNKDYTCDKVIGSFDGQFAKPFRPLSVAISHFNHYFILDDENKQIVVCDENGKIIKIITLPENTEEVFDIALMDDFVLVTLSLTSLDTSVRPEDRGDRLVKYTQSGEYLAEVNGQIRGQGQFYRPVSVVVNSNNVIMVYDTGNGCIKCFDSDLNFLHQFGQSQLSERILGYYGYIAVDEDDNVYVCNYYFDRIHKYRCDGKWICNLLEGNVR
ncbi:putative autophagy-related protein 11 [Ptychodera flava]|uniref:putative autophagy-related protein 11 n=1 Tax=Ptychodera flava TaxID=63121 RepID=UPI003969C23D